MSQADGNNNGVTLSFEGAMTTVEKVASYNLPDVFGESDPDGLRRVAEELEDEIEELAEDPMNNRKRIEDLAFKRILLLSMANDDITFRGERMDDESEATSDEAGDDGDGQEDEEENGGTEQGIEQLEEAEEQENEAPDNDEDEQDEEDDDEDEQDEE